MFSLCLCICILWCGGNIEKNIVYGHIARCDEHELTHINETGMVGYCDDIEYREYLDRIVLRNNEEKSDVFNGSFGGNISAMFTMINDYTYQIRNTIDDVIMGILYERNNAMILYLQYWPYNPLDIFDCEIDYVVEHDNFLNVSGIEFMELTFYWSNYYMDISNETINKRFKSEIISYFIDFYNNSFSIDVDSFHVYRDVSSHIVNVTGNEPGNILIINITDIEYKISTNISLFEGTSHLIALENYTNTNQDIIFNDLSSIIDSTYNLSNQYSHNSSNWTYGSNTFDYDLFCNFSFVPPSPAPFPPGSEWIICVIVVGILSGISTAVIVFIAHQRKWCCFEDKMEDTKDDDDKKWVLQPQKSQENINSTTDISLQEPMISNTATNMSSSNQNQESIKFEMDNLLKSKELIEFKKHELSIEKCIGRGSFGKVFKATYKGFNVAMKLFNQSNNIDSENIDNSENYKELYSEIVLASKIRYHPCIIKIFGVCKHPLSVIMEHLGGGSIKTIVYGEHVSKPEPSNIEKLIILLKASNGLKVLNEEYNITHRDIAARNILISDYNINAGITMETMVKISDFNMSRKNEHNNIQKTDNNIGPIKWMSPESLKDSIYNEYTDVYMFGITMWEIMYGEEPYKFETTIDIMMRVITKDYRPQFKWPLPYGLEHLITLCWNKDINIRPDFKTILSKLDEVYNDANNEVNGTSEQELIPLTDYQTMRQDSTQ